MRNFSWNCFQITGSVDAYLLYKDLNIVPEEYTSNSDQRSEQEEESGLEL